MKENPAILRTGWLNVSGQEKIKVVIIDLGENLERGGIPNHEKIEIVFEEKEDET